MKKRMTAGLLATVGLGAMLIASPDALAEQRQQGPQAQAPSATSIYTTEEYAEEQHDRGQSQQQARSGWDVKWDQPTQARTDGADQGAKAGREVAGLEGTVRRMGRATMQEGQGEHLIVEVESASDDGRKLLVDLGPAENFRDARILVPGAKLTITGQMGEHNGSEVLTARSVTLPNKESRTIQTHAHLHAGQAAQAHQPRGQDDSRSAARQSRRVQVEGWVSQVGIAQLRGSDTPRQVVRLQNEDGWVATVDLGPKDALEGYELVGKKVQASGRHMPLGGRMVLFADELLVEGRREDIRGHNLADYRRAMAERGSDQDEALRSEHWEILMFDVPQAQRQREQAQGQKELADRRQDQQNQQQAQAAQDQSSAQSRARRHHPELQVQPGQRVQPGQTRQDGQDEQADQTDMADRSAQSSQRQSMQVEWQDDQAAQDQSPAQPRARRHQPQLQTQPGQRMQPGGQSGEAGQDEQPAQSGQAAQAGQQRLQGEVSQVLRLNTARGEALTIVLKNQQGQQQLVDLGPANRLGSLQLKQGDQVQITGRSMEDGNLMRADQITSGGRTVRIQH